jgi:hypothetical protein
MVRGAQLMDVLQPASFPRSTSLVILNARSRATACLQRVFHHGNSEVDRIYRGREYLADEREAREEADHIRNWYSGCTYGDVNNHARRNPPNKEVAYRGALEASAWHPT